jgi:hypothetical protein
MKTAHKILVGRHQETRPLGRPRGKGKDNIKMDIEDVRYEGVDWIS